MEPQANTIHELPGRLRLDLPGIYRRPRTAELLEARLLETPGVQLARSSACTGHLLVLYDATVLRTPEVLRTVADLLPQIQSGPALRALTRPDESPPPGPGAAVALPAAFLGAVVARQLLTGRSAISQSPVLQGASAVIGLVSAYPIVRDSLSRRAGPRSRTHLLLAAGSLLLLAARESLPGLAVLLLLNLSRWAEAAAMSRAQRALPPGELPANWPAPLGQTPPTPGERRFGLISLLVAGVVLLTTRSLPRALAVLVVGSPAIRNAARPVAHAQAVAGAVATGVYPRTAAALEGMARVDTVLIETPGALASGEPEVTAVLSVHPDYPERRVLQLAAESLAALPLPVARAVISRAEQNGLSPKPNGARLTELSNGRGAYARILGVRTLVGDAGWLAGHHVPLQRAKLPALRLETAGDDVLYIAHGRKVVGLIGLRYEPSPETWSAVESLREAGLDRLIAFTRSPLQGGTALARRLGLSLLEEPAPEEAIRAMQRDGHGVALIGFSEDAVMAARAADLVIVPAASPAAQRADIALAGKGLDRLAPLLRMTRVYREIARQNQLLGAAVNTVGLTWAVGGGLSLGAALLLQDLTLLATIGNARRLAHMPQVHRPAGPLPEAAETIPVRPLPPMAGGSAAGGARPSLVPPALHWHTLPLEETALALKTDLQTGLTEQRATHLLTRYGPNTLAEPTPPTLLQLFLRQYKDLMVLTLVGASGMSLALGAVKEALSILGVLLINGLFGMAQEYHTSKTVSALRKLAAPSARVIRESVLRVVPAVDLVPGDLLFLEPGDRVPADARLVAAFGLEVEEASLSGESVPSRKRVAVLEHLDLHPGDRHNMIFLGTTVVRGYGRAVVTGTGMATEMGRILTLLEESEESPTPLKRRLDSLGKVLLIVSVAVAAGVTGIGLIRGQPLMPMFMTGVSLAVAAIPEGLPAVVTIALATGVRRMMHQKAVARRLSAIETLGMVSVICSDKTGTMTRNELQVRKLYTGASLWDVAREPDGRLQVFLADGASLEGSDHPDVIATLVAAAACTDGQHYHPEESGSPSSPAFGDPMDVALRASVGALSREIPPELRLERVRECPFDSERRRVTVLTRTGEGRYLLLSKGAPEAVVGLCRFMQRDGARLPLVEPEAEAWGGVMDRMAEQALRVIGVAWRDVTDLVGEAGSRDLSSDPARWDALEREMTFLGLIGMMDPPRPEVAEALRTCEQAGVRVMMVTGDHPATAAAVAREVGLMRPGARILTGTELDRLSDEELVQMLPSTAICARVAPRHKLRIVRALRQAGHVVAMTGDGVNDAPAVKEADVGIAMGQGGSDATKEASEIVLTDDNFATIVRAIEEGRGVRGNIRRALGFLMAGNSGEVIVMLLGGLAGLPLPLLPTQLLLVNLLSDSLPALVLACGQPDQLTTVGPPPSPEESLFSRGLREQVLVRGSLIGLGTFGMYAWGLSTGSLERARSLALATLVLTQWAQVPDWQYEGNPQKQAGRKPESLLSASLAVSAALLPLVFHVPVLAGLFGTVPLSLLDWLLVSGATAAVGATSRAAGAAASGAQARLQVELA